LGAMGWFSGVLDGFGAADPPENFLAMHSDGNTQLRILSPTLLELTLVQEKQPDPAPLSKWNFVNTSGIFVPPAASEFAVTANGQPITVSTIGFKRRALYAPLKTRDLRVASSLYLQLSSSIASGASVTVQNPDATLWTTNVFAATADPLRYSPAIHVNQVGYMPTLSKKAMIGYYLGSLGEMPITSANGFSIVDASSGATVFTGALTLRPDVGYSYTPIPYQHVYEADFSAFQTPGEYKLVVPGLGASFPFLIDDGVAATIARTYELGMYHQRSGTNNVFPFTRFTHDPDHIAPAQIPVTNAFVDYTVGQDSGGQMSNCAASHFPFVNKGTVDVSGGHFDAGDYSKYTIDVTLLIHHLIFSVDAIPGVKDLDNLGIPESGDGISDVMQEAKWESDFLAKMQDADGGFYFLVYPLSRPYELDVLPDHGDPQVVFPKNTSATAASVAALAEMASSPTFKATYPQTAAIYLQKAILGWQFLTNAFNKYGRTNAYQKITFYGDTFADKDEIAWAAAALYTATGDARYDNDLRANTPNPNDPQYRQWTWWSMYGSYGCAFRDYAFAARSGRLATNQLNAAYLAACEGEVRFAATNAMNFSAKMAYGSSFSDENKGLRVGGWYFSGEQTFDLATAYQLEAKPDYLDVILKNYNYELGCNPLNQSFVTGLGWKRQREIVDQYAQNDYRTLPPSGIPLGNIQAGFDWLQNYGNELSNMSFPSDSSNTNTYPYYDRWSDTFNTTTEFCTYQQAKSLAAAAMLMAASSAKTQAWSAQSGFVAGVPTNATPVAQPVTVSPNIAGLDLSKARIVWEARDQEPFIGPTFTFSPKCAGLQWLEMEAQLPDGRRVFALTNFFAAQAVTNVIENYQTTSLLNDTNVLAWYTLDGTKTNALGGSLNPVQFVGGIWYDTNSFTWSNRPNGACVRVTDVGQSVYLTLPNAALYQAGQTRAISVEAMLYINKLTAYGRANANLMTLNRSWNTQIAWVQNMWITDPYIMGGANIIAGASAITNNFQFGQWQHLRLTLTATNYSVSVNGVVTTNVPSSDLATWAGSGNVTLEIGNFDGWVDEIVIKSFGTPAASSTASSTPTTSNSPPASITSTTPAMGATNYIASPAPVDSSVVALYHFDNNLAEASGRFPIATLSGLTSLNSSNLTWMASPSGTALRFTDVGDSATISLTNVSLYQNGQIGSIGVEAMVFVKQFKAYSRQSATIINLAKRWDTQLYLEQDMWGTSPQFIGGTQTLLPAANLAPYLQTNCWQKISLLLDTNGYSVRVNDYEVFRTNSMDITNWSSASTLSLTLGNFDGWMDEVVVRKQFTTPPATNAPIAVTNITGMPEPLTNSLPGITNTPPSDPVTVSNTPVIPDPVIPGPTNVVDTNVVITVPAPVVSISALVDTILKNSPTPAQVQVTRVGDTTSPLAVTFALGGTATAGSDYVPISTSVTIPAGSASAMVNIDPIDGDSQTSDETVVLTLAPNANYTIGSASAATVTIVDLPHVRIIQHQVVTTQTTSTPTKSKKSTPVTITPAPNLADVQADAADSFSIVLQASSDFVTWNSITTNFPGAAVDYIDPSTTNLTSRFYRAVYVSGDVTAANITAAINANSIADGVVGFINISAPAGFSLIADPLEASQDSGLVSTLPSGARVLTFNDGSVAVAAPTKKSKGPAIGSWGVPGKTWTKSTAAPLDWQETIYNGTSWSNPDLLPGPGEGAFFYNPGKTALKLTFMGKVMPAGTTNNIPAGYSIRSSVAPIAGQLDTTLGMPVTAGDVVFRYNGKGYTSYTYSATGWNTKPVLKVGEAVFIQKTTQASWTNSVPNF